MNVEIFTCIITGIGVVIAVVSFFDNMLTKFKLDLDKRFDKIDNDLKEIENDLKELRTGLNRIEGAFYSKDCCMLKEDKNLKKAG